MIVDDNDEPSQLTIKRLAVLQPGYLPWLGFFDQLRRADVFVIYDDVQYDKNGWRNRNRIKGACGPLWLTVPVNIERLDTKITEVKIDYRSNWQKKHIGSIKQYYSKAPFFNEYFPAIEDLIEASSSHLVDLNLAFISSFCDWLALSTPVYRSSELTVLGDRNLRLVNLCKHFGATRYLSGNAAQSYLDTQLFAENNISVEWQNYVHPNYKQLGCEFVPYLSALDLVLNHGPEGATILRAHAQSTTFSNSAEPVGDK